VEENLRLVPLPSSQGKLSTFTPVNIPGSLSLDQELVEADGGHDLGTVTLTGDLAEKQFRQKEPSGEKDSLKKVYRKATQGDLENWLNAKRRERDVLLEARRLAGEMSLFMSIGDVEFQGDRQEICLCIQGKNRDETNWGRQEAAKIGGRFITKWQTAATIPGLKSRWSRSNSTLL
jgi:hypothetical protein